MKIKRFINIPVSSNSYVIYDDVSKEAIIIDPGSKELNEISEFIKKNSLFLRYIILTHEHFDHVWGVKFLLSRFQALLVCSKKCYEKISIPQNYFNLLYCNSSEYYSIDKVDILIEDIDNHLFWNNCDIYFLFTPGHSSSSICVEIENNLFTGDTIMKGFNPFIKKKA